VTDGRTDNVPYMQIYEVDTNTENEVEQLIEGVRYTTESRWFDSQWSHWDFFNWLNPSGRTTALRSTQPLIQMSTRNIFWRVKAAGA
jgi:hypothetical protein